MTRKKKPNPLNLFQRSQLFRDTFEKWKQANLNPQEPNHAEPPNESYEGNHPDNQNMVQEKGNRSQDSVEPTSESPDGSQITFPLVLNEIMETLHHQTDFIAGLEGRIKTLEKENQEMRSRLVEIEETETVEEGLAFNRVFNEMTDEDEDDDEDDEEEWDEEEIEEILEEVVASYEEEVVEMLEKHLSRYFKHLNDSLAQLDEKSKELDRLLPIFKKNVEAYITRQEQKKELAKVYRNLSSFIRREFAPLHQQIRRDRLGENRTGYYTRQSATGSRTSGQSRRAQETT